MLNSSSQNIIVFVILCTILILLLISFVAFILFRYQQKQNAYFKDIESLKTSYENTMLQSQLEIQEQTFQNISREIHDNIGQKLTLAKLHLNTLTIREDHPSLKQVAESVNMIGEAINDLSDISRSMSSEIVLNNGFLNAVEFEAMQLRRPGLYTINVNTSGNPVFLNANTELVLFRILQEALNNIVKHAGASLINIRLHYSSQSLLMEIADNGKGFNTEMQSEGTGLRNIRKRGMLLNGNMRINSNAGNGTTLQVEIPINNNDAKI